MSKQIYTPSQALAYLITELESILASRKLGFNQAINRRLNKMMDDVMLKTTDEQFQMWMSCHGIRGYIGKMYTGEVLGPYLKACRDLLVCLRYGEFPEGLPVMHESELYEMEWWDPREIVVTDDLPNYKRGTATVFDTEGLYKFAFGWEILLNDEAEEAGLPALVNITSAEVRFPKVFTIINKESDVIYPLEFLQELDCMQGFSGSIFNHVCKGEIFG